MAVPEIHVGVLVGYPEYDQGQIYNSAVLLAGGGRVLARHRKACHLPNYKVFDEKALFPRRAANPRWWSSTVIGWDC